jgi:hypothetical protein
MVLSKFQENGTTPDFQKTGMKKGQSAKAPCPSLKT